MTVKMVKIVTMTATTAFFSADRLQLSSQPQHGCILVRETGLRARAVAAALCEQRCQCGSQSNGVCFL